MASIILSIVQELLRETRKIMAAHIFAGGSIHPLVAAQPRQQVAWATRLMKFWGSSRKRRDKPA
jgi:hypothetical protein